MDWLHQDDDHGVDHDDDHDDHGDGHEVDLVVLRWIGSGWMTPWMRKREVERTVGPLQSVYWS